MKGSPDRRKIHTARVTYVTYEDGTEEVIVDDWTRKDREHMSLLAPWRGKTQFFD